MKKLTRLAVIGTVAAAVTLGAATPALAAGDDPNDLPCNSGGGFQNDSGRWTYWWNNCDDSRSQEIVFAGVGTGWTQCAPPGVNELVPDTYFYSATWTGKYC